MNRPNPNMTLRALLLAPTLVLLGACGGGGTEPPAPSTIVAVTTNPVPSVVVGSVIAPVPTFEVRRANGRPLAGVAVTVSVTAGGGALVGAPSLSLAGPTPIGQWTLGTTSGVQTVTVSVANVPSLVFTVTANAGAPTQFAIVDGDDQFGTQNQPTFAPLRVRARDQFNNPVPGATVTWAIDAGGGSFAGGATTSQTDANGIAVAPAWTLGSVAAGEQAVVATLGAFSARFTATAQLAPASITVEQAVPASATVFTQHTPSFAVRDGNGDPLQGVPVAVAITAGNGTLTGAPTVSALGATSVGTWRLGQVAGTQTVTVTVPGLPVRTFTIDAVPDAPAQLQILQGSGQTAFAGAALPLTPRVRVVDQFGNGISGQNVTFAVTAGGGAIAGPAVIATAGNGNAEAGVWTLGRRGGAQSITATSGALSAEITAAIQSAYNVTLRFVGTPPTGATAQAFQDAVNRIQAMVVGDMANVQIGSTANPFNISQCNANFTDVPPINEQVDDVLIYAGVGPIDGVGQVLGSAGPCQIRTNGRQPITGTMRFDSADLDNLAANGRLGSVILHEMLHVVGIGTMWSDSVVNLLRDADLPSVRVVGALAANACATTLGAPGTCPGFVPAENCENLPGGTSCGAGTRNSHWKESTFQTELMTGYLAATNSLSVMSIQGLADLGYTVNLLAADPYVIPGTLVGLLRAEGDVHEPAAAHTAMPQPTLPMFTVDRDGRTRRIRR